MTALILQMSRRFRTWRAWSGAAALAFYVFQFTPALAAEVNLQPECTTDRAMVTLGDVAKINSADAKEAETLAAIELFPTPPAGQPRYVRVRELQDLLALRGVNLAEHNLSGASQITITRADAPHQTPPEKPLSAAILKKVHRQVHDAITDYLAANAPGEKTWTVTVELDPSQARLLSGPTRGISVSGGSAPWTGKQQFDLKIQTESGPVQLTVLADVSLPPAVVVATRSLPRGAIIGPADVRLEVTSEPAAPQRAEAFNTLDDVVGREVTSLIPVGKPIDRNAVCSPLLIRRGEVVTVSARSPGICVRTTARARQDGSLGDLVSLESMLDRKTFYARVCGTREAEVYAQAVQAERSAAGGSDTLWR